MSNKQYKEIKSLPPFYQNFNRDTAALKLVVVEDIHMGYYSYDTVQQIHILRQAQQKVWVGEEDFSKQNEQTILTYHENLFENPVPKGQSLVETSLWCWYKIINLAVDRSYRHLKSDKTSGRKSTILNRLYFDGVEGTGDLKTPQALDCIRLFREALIAVGENHGEPGKEVRSITEEKLKQHITDNASALRTRQDPWRIFQYYRPNLLANKLIRHN